ncbi:ADP-L-glycero-D-manno-heptose-6-epimerase [Methylocapsa aurea]|uniref:ADP-glyceromanno-heptose 6-epimerase n=1 Tax=Methylocapsa aurea TaxID=663610 RepID=UPI003D18C0CD
MIVVTGATGFIGSNLVADLNEAGVSDIVLVDVLGKEAKWKNIAKRRFLDLIFPQDFGAFLKGAPKVEAIFHMGANSSTIASDGDAIFLSNLRASMNVWNWCSQTRTPLVYASSAATYGDGSEGFVDDQSPEALDKLRPLNLYGWTKHAFDKWALAQAARGNAPPSWVGLKFFNVYGPNEGHKGDMQSLIAKVAGPIAEGETISLFKSHKDGFTDGEQLRDFVYVRDCTSVMGWLLTNPGVSGLFNLGTGHARSFRDLVLATGNALDKTPAISFVEMPESIRPNYQYFTQADMSKLRTAGYSLPFWSLEAGVRDYVTKYLACADRFR